MLTIASAEPLRAQPVERVQGRQRPACPGQDALEAVPVEAGWAGGRSRPAELKAGRAVSGSRWYRVSQRAELFL